MAPLVVNLIPTYNEKENISNLLTQIDMLALKHPAYKWITLIVDDNSPDGTGDIARKFKGKKVKTIVLSGPREGLGKAMIRGMKYITTHLKPFAVITNEADFAYDLNLIPKTLDFLKNGYDAVISTRHGEKAGTKGWTYNRYINHYIANTIFAGLVAGVNQLKDHNGAFRTVRYHGYIDSIDWDSFPTKGFVFFNYWAYIITTQTSKIYQMPITYHFRTQGESKISFNPKYLSTYFHDVWEYIFICIKIRFNKIKTC